MKKNININLFGTLYNIDEDAYQLLEKYLSNMKSYFSRQEGGDEIADDIEHRIAELFWELKQSGVEAIDVNMVRTIIEKIGNPEQMDDSQASSEQDYQDATEEPEESARQRFANQSKAFARASSETLKDWMSHRKFFRDDHDKVIAGVLSGLSQYCGGGDPLAWRIAFVVLVLCLHSLMFLPIIVYLIAWLIAPVAKTAEDRLWMRGEAVSPDKIRDEVLNEQNRNQQKPESQQSKGSGFRSFLVGMVNLVGLLTKALLIFIAGCFLVLAIGVVICLISVIFTITTGIAGVGTIIPLSVSYLITDTYPLILGLVGCFLILSIISVYALVRWLRQVEKPMSTSHSIIMLVLWSVALFAIIPISLALASRIDKLDKQGLLTDPAEELTITEEDDSVVPPDTLILDTDIQRQLVDTVQTSQVNPGLSTDTIVK